MKKLNKTIADITAQIEHNLNNLQTIEEQYVFLKSTETLIEDCLQIIKKEHMDTDFSKCDEYINNNIITTIKSEKR